MFRFLIIILALAAYGANSLLNNVTNTVATTTQKVVEPGAATSMLSKLSTAAGALAVDTVSQATGLDVRPMPTYGCSSNNVSSDKIQALLATLPEAQRGALEGLISSSMGYMPILGYSGELGMGLCLPYLKKMVLLPEQAKTILGLTD